MTARRITVVTAGLSQPSSTRLLADRLADATAERLRADGVEVEVAVVELREFAQDITNMMLTGFAAPRLQQVLDGVESSHGVIAVTPIFTTSYSGLFKSFFDVIDPATLEGMPVLIGATAGTPRHSLALDYALRPMFTYLHATVMPTGVFAASEDWGSGADRVKALPDRITRAARELAAAVADSPRSGAVRDPFALDPSFDPSGLR